jgi:periplasmic protein TonB
MSVAVANPLTLSLRRFLVYSAILHALLLIWIGIAAYTTWLGPQWTGAGGGGGSVTVKLVSSAGIPMPQPPAVTESKTVDVTKSLYPKEEVKPEPEPPTPAKEIPQFHREKPLPPSRPSRVFQNPTPPPPNAVPGPSSGAPRIPSGYSATPGSQGPIAAQDQGGGDFASRYSWYIEAVKRRIQGNWLQNTIDPAVRAARAAKTTVQFTIYRDGTIREIHVTQGSGNLSMDNSGLRAVMASNPMPALPNDYSGTYVTVIFDFDLSMTR